MAAADPPLPEGQLQAMKSTIFVHSFIEHDDDDDDKTAPKMAACTRTLDNGEMLDGVFHPPPSALP